MAIEAGKYIKWSVTGSTAYGKVASVKDDVISVILPNDTVAEIKDKNVVVIDEAEYQENIEKLAETLAAKTKAGKGKKMAECEMKKKEDEMCAEIAALKKEIEALTAAKTDLTSRLDASEKAKTEISAKLDEINKKALAAERFDKLKACEAVAFVADSDEAAKTALAEMSDKEFAMILKAGQTSLAKLTEARKTSLPPSTGETKTGETKLTEAEEKAAAEAKAQAELAKAEAEKKAQEEALATAAANNESEPTNHLLNWTKAVLLKNKKTEKNS